MKKIKIITLVITLITLFSSCQTSTDTKQVLAKQETRREIMDTIANNSNMSKEMIETMMNSKNGKMMMQGNGKMMGMMLENNGSMIKMMKENPAMIQTMMSNMLEACKSDTSLMSSMCKTLIGNEQMMGIIQNMKGRNTDMNNTGGMNNMEGMDHKTEKKEGNK